MTVPADDLKSIASGRDATASVFNVLTPVLREWKVVLGLTVTAGIVAAAIVLVVPPTYTASTTFVSAVGTSGLGLSGDLAGLATQFGFNVGAGGSLSPDFFASVLVSRELLRATLLSQFDDPRHTGPSRSLLDILNVDGPTEPERIDNGIRRLTEDISQRVERRTGIVTLSVAGRPPSLVAAVANRMVQLLNQFNLDRLQSQSRERRRFTGERKDEAERELREAEARHLGFLQSNRRYADSPLLSFEENRLAREVQLRQEVFQTLTREYEQARIAEVRDTPLLTIIDPAVPPDRRSFPPRKLIVFLVMVAGALTALTVAYFREYQRAAELESRTEYRSFLQAWGDAKAEMRAALRLRARR